MNRFAFAAAVAASALAVSTGAQAQQSSLQGMAAAHAAANGIPMSLMHRVIMRESRYNPRAVSKGNYGIMQIRLGTARAMGYTGSAQGLLDPNVNMQYAAKYLAGAYRAAGGNESRAVSLYASGYYYHAKRQGWNAYTQQAMSSRRPVETASYSPFVPQQAQRTASYRRPARVAASTQTYVNPFAAFQQQPAPHRTYRNYRVATYNTTYNANWNPFAALFAPPKEQRVTRNGRSKQRYARYQQSDSY